MIGFSLSPGGLLLPYHLGVLAALSYHGYVTDQTPLAGSSAGAIAVASQAVGVPSHVALEASMRISQQCNPLFLAKGGLMKSLRQQLNTLFPENALEIVNHRPGAIGLAHLQLYPQNKAVVATQSFATRDALVDAVCDSSMFPYFTSNQPFRIKRAKHGAPPEVVVDGVFTEPVWRFGCPDQRKQWPDLERSVCVSVFPQELVGLGVAHAASRNNVISPPLQTNAVGQVTKLGLLACTPGRRQDLSGLYEDGWRDAEEWVHIEERLSDEPVRLPVRRISK